MEGLALMGNKVLPTQKLFPLPLSLILPAPAGSSSPAAEITNDKIIDKHTFRWDISDFQMSWDICSPDISF